MVEVELDTLFKLLELLEDCDNLLNSFSITTPTSLEEAMFLVEGLTLEEVD